MNDHDGFTTVNDPREYLNAPAMLMMDNADNRPVQRAHSPPKMPLILKAAVDYAADLDILSADELQQYYAEQSSLERRLADVVNRLDVELKMREAANSISKLHAGETTSGSATGNRRTSTSSNRSSIISNFTPLSPKPSNRFSRLLGQDAQSKSEKRLSKQAADEVAISEEKIRDLERFRNEVERRKNTVDRTIMQHHCAVMSRALSNKPLPNHHQRSRSGASAISSLSQNTGRQSWIMAPRHQRQWSSNSNGDSASLATVTEHKTPTHSRRPSGSPAIPAYESHSHLEDEIDSLITRISQVLPHASPSPQGKVSFIANAFDSMFRELSDARNALEASRVQVEHSEQRMQYLMMQHSQVENQMQNRSLEGQSQASRQSSGTADELTLKELRHELDSERSNANHWRNRAEQQRKQLDVMSQSLENVTSLAVQLEGDHTNLQQLVTVLETKVNDLESENVKLLQQKLKSASNSSLLCQEFQHIVSELVIRHDKEVRVLYPKFSNQRQSVAELTNANHAQELGGGGQEEPDVPVQSPRRSLSPRRSPSPRRSQPQQYLQQPQYGQAQLHQSPRLSQPLQLEHPQQASQHHPLPEVNPGRGAVAGNNASYVEQTRNQTTNPSSGGLKLPSDNAARIMQPPSPVSTKTNDPDVALPQPLESSFDDSIQHTHESLMTRPSLEREDTEVSDYSKSSSFYPEAPSANQSQISIATGKRSQYGMTPHSNRQYSYEDEIL